ncbi:MAG: hypothetical protein JXO22_04210 [Phycisphaerae bacterium]|nr:hypothetical protein [Phycisphaerae bacterium]
MADAKAVCAGAGETPVESPPRRGSGWLVVMVGLACALLATNNWCFALVPAALAVLWCDLVVRCGWPRLGPRLAVAGVVGVGLGIALRVGPDWAFEEAFGVERPAGVSNVWIRRHYIGGPGEHALIIEFTADPAALARLTTLYKPDANSTRAEQWRAAGGTWEDAWNIFGRMAPMPAPRASWMRIKPLENAEVFDYGGVMQVVGNLVLFHEPSTGRCVALHIRF